MTILSIKDETHEALKRLKLTDETDEALIERIVEYARCYMVIKGAIPSKEDDP